MEHKLMELPYAKDALDPVISKETIEYHYGKHHQKYVDTLNSLVQGTEFENKSLVDIIKTSDGAIFNNAAQVYNHNFYWLGLSPNTTNFSTKLQQMIERDFETFESFKEEFIAQATKNFGSGWTWLVFKAGKLGIMNTSNADNPVAHDITPLLTCDIWEHAYYIDYRNARPEYLTKWWNIVNWEFVSTNLTQALSNG